MKSFILILSVLVVFIITPFYSVAQDVLISDGGTVYVTSGQKFYDAGGPTGNDGNTSYTITLCPSDPNHKVALDFLYFETTWNWMWDEEDPLYIYDGTTATGDDIGKLMGNYSDEYDTGTDPYSMGIPANNGQAMIDRPTIFAATNSTGCLTLVFENNESYTNRGWAANIYTFSVPEEPGCNIEFNADTTICPGETVTLTTTGSVVSGHINNSFNDGTIGTGWSATSSATITNTSCEPSPDGSLYLWMQNAPGPRALVTNPMDVSDGGAISFEYRQARNNGAASPCESPDRNMSGSTPEGIYLQYSTDGTTWTTFKYIFPNGTEGSGAEGGLTGCGDYVKRWTKMQYPIPVAAQTSSTQFRWLQSMVTNSSTDNWGLDNIVISTTEPTTSIEIVDLSTGLTIASSTTPPLTVDVTPSATTSYRAIIGDGVTTCDSIFTITLDNAACPAEPCGTCATPDCNIAGPFSTATAANDPTNHCSASNVLSVPATDSTYVSYHTITSSNDGTFGLIVSEATTQIVGTVCDITETALIYPADPCNPATAISPDAVNPNAGVTSYNPEWYWLSPNTTYILEISLTVSSDCQIDEHCESYYYPKAVCDAYAGTVSVLINGVDVTDPSNQYTVCWGDEIEFLSNGDYVLQNPAGSDPNGMGFTFWSDFPADLTSPETNLGWMNFEYNENTGNLTNDGSGLLPGNYYVSPITFDDICSSTPCDANQGYDVNSDGCWDIGDVIEFIFVEEIIADAGVDETLTCGSPTVLLDGTGSTGSGLSYAWTGPGIVSGANTATPEVNAIGTYTLVVTSNAVCTATDDVVVDQDVSLPTADAGTVMTLDCNFSSISLDGSASSSGVNYTYVWSTADGNIVSGSNTTTPIVDASGTYTLTVTDTNNGCTAEDQVLVNEDLSAPSADAGSDMTMDCISSSINLDGSASSSGANYTFAWSTIDGNIVSGNSTTSPTVDASGTYTIVVTDTNNGCTAEDQVNVVEDINTPIAEAGNDMILDCNNSSLNLDASASSTGANFSYLWSTADGNIISGANTTNPLVDATGTYFITVTDSNNGCTSTDQVIVSENFVAPVSSAGIDQELTCAVSELTLDGTGSASGTNISFEWSTTTGSIVSGELTNQVTINSEGTYYLTVTDNDNGCTSVDDVIVTNSMDMPIANAGVDDELNCITSSIQLDGSGSSTGTQYEYLWTGPAGGITSGQNTLTPIITIPGIYTLAVTDVVNSCTAYDAVDISGSFNLPNASAGLDQTLTCAVTNVILDGTASDSGAAYQAEWTTSDGNIVSGQNDYSATADMIGTYVLTVTNTSNGCTASDAVQVFENTTAPIANAGPDMELNCYSTSLMLDGSGSDTGSQYEYLWTTTNGNIVTGSNTPNPTVNYPGIYVLTVINSSTSCVSSDEVTVSQFITPPNVTAGGDQELTCANTSVVLDGTGSDSGVNFQIEWTTVDGNFLSGENTLSPRIDQPGTYQLVITNILNGCSASDNVMVIENTILPVANAGVDDDIPCGLSSLNLDGSLSSTGSEYLYLWTTSNGNIVSGNNGLYPEINSAGTYRLRVTNSLNGCTAQDEVIIVESNGLIVSSFVQDVLCYGESSGEINLTVTGGTEPYSVDWSNGLSGLNVGNLSAGWYNYTITDANFCTSQDAILISQANSPMNMTSMSQNVSCYGFNDGSISVEVEGGTPPYQYFWLNEGNASGNLSVIQNLNEGFYSVLVTDANDCSLDTSFVITQPAEIEVGYAFQGPSCIGNSDGYIDLNVSGGVQPYEYHWDNYTGNVPYLDGLYEGSYDVIIRDANSCEFILETILLVDNPEECIRIPNAFTPNGDDNNDTWIIENLDLFNKYNVKVYNRWGQLLYTGYPGAETWDGTTVDGKLVPCAAYVYVIDLYNGEEAKTGIVTVIY
jgi:gliding motility-associated-like protein